MIEANIAILNGSSIDEVEKALLENKPTFAGMDGRTLEPYAWREDFLIEYEEFLKDRRAYWVSSLRKAKEDREVD